MMTVAELVEKLQAVEDKSLPVVVRLDEAEDEDVLYAVRTCTSDASPYCKGCSAFEMYPCLKGRPALYLIG